MIHATACAKINYTLHITGKRDDGYHLLESLMLFTDLHDHLTFSQADELSLSVSGPFASAVGNHQDNLVLRAANILREKCDMPNAAAAITLDKHIPAGAGLGGGSADAAATLIALNRLWQCALSTDQLATLALALGADVPACLHAPKPVFMSGIGEHVQPADASQIPVHAVLVKPPHMLNTGEIYAQYQPQDGGENHLQPAAIRVCPHVQETIDALAALPGCVTARMSGSGSACFGVFSAQTYQQQAADTLSQNMPQHWVMPVLLQN